MGVVAVIVPVVGADLTTRMGFLVQGGDDTVAGHPTTGSEQGRGNGLGPRRGGGVINNGILGWCFPEVPAGAPPPARGAPRRAPAEHAAWPLSGDVC